MTYQLLVCSTNEPKNFSSYSSSEKGLCFQRRKYLQHSTYQLGEYSWLLQPRQQILELRQTQQQIADS
jgi:hypothetical protein